MAEPTARVLIASFCSSVRFMAPAMARTSAASFWLSAIVTYELAKLLTIMGIDDQWGRFVRIVHDSRLASEAERVACFEAEGLGDRATYYRWKKKLSAR